MLSGAKTIFRPFHVLGLLFVLSFALASTVQARQSDGFYRTEGFFVLDANGNPAMQRGVGLGGWLMPEAYMLHYPKGASTTVLTRDIEALIGPADTEAFWDLYREFYVGEADVQAIADWGFDHIRLPFHYGLFMDIETGAFIEDGFELLDEFLGWCEDAGLPVILDLHAAPGAQSEGDIADSDGVARLWTEPVPYQNLTIALWEEFARRYVNDTRIMGYDLINEPVTPGSIGDGAAALRSLYDRLVAAVRAIDTNHILFIEGNYWATTFDKLTPPFDDNMVYAFHKYWNTPDTGTIQYLLNMRNEHRVPLWLGETGENSNVWFSQTVDLAERNAIGWNIWTHKKIQTTTSALSAPLKPAYRQVLDYIGGWGDRPTAEFARDALFEMARSLHIDSTEVRPGVLEALFNPNFGTMRRPYQTHWLPGVIGAAEYDIGTQGKTYFDEDYWAITGAPGGGNSGAQLRNDGVDIERSEDVFGSEYNVGWLEPGEWMEYTVSDAREGTYDVEFRVSSGGSGGSFELWVDDTRTAPVTAPGTGGWQTWTSVWIRGLEIDSPTPRIRFVVLDSGGFNFNQMEFHQIGGEDPGSETDFRLGSIYPSPASSSASVEFQANRAAEVELSVYDVLGRERIARAGSYTEGQHELTFSVADLASGMYIVELRFDDGDRSSRRYESLIVTH